MLVSVVIVVGIAWLALSIWVMFVVLEAATEAREWFGNENRKRRQL